MAFSNCANLKTVTCSSTMTAFGPAAFIESSLTSITIPATIERVDERAFQSCAALTNVTIEEGVKVIGPSAFSGCSGLASIAFPTTLERLEQYAFAYSGLASVAIRQNTKEVGASAFYYCSNLSSVSIGSSSTIIGEEAFAGTKWMDNQPVGPVYLDNRLISFKGEMDYDYTLEVKDGTVAIAARAIPYSGTYKYDEKLVAVTLPSSLKYIGERAFSNSKITTVIIPDNVTYVGAGAFGWSLTGEVKVGKSVSYIGNQGCGRSLDNITIDSGNLYLTKADGMLYNRNTGHLFLVDLPAETTSLTFPSSIKYITDAYFAGECSRFTSLTFGQNISNTDANGNEIKFGEFFKYNNFTGLTYFSVSENSPYFSAVDGSLYNKDQTTLIAVPAGRSTSTLTMPETVTRVDNRACAGNGNITAVVLSPKCIAVGEGAFEGCENLRDVDLGRDLQVLEEYAFYNCYALESLTLPTTFSLLGEMGGKSYLGNLKRLVIQSLGDISVYVGDYDPSVTLEYPCVTSLTVTGNTDQLNTKAYDGVFVNGEFTRSDSYSSDYQSVPNALYFSTDPSQSGQENYVVVTNTPTTEAGTGGEDPKDPGKKEVALRFHQRAKAPALSGVDAYCENLVLQDGVAFNSPMPFTAQNVTMDIDVNYLIWRTISIPFACDVHEGLAAEYLELGKEPTLTNAIIDYTSVTSLEPGKAYIICSTTGSRAAASLSASNVTVGQDLPADNSALIGNIGEPLALDDAFRAKPENVGYNFFLYNPYTDNWDLQDTSGVVPTNQAYLRLANTISPVFTPYHNGVISSVENISIDAPAADAIYDIYGRPVTNPSAPGIYIINGKKVRIP